MASFIPQSRIKHFNNFRALGFCGLVRGCIKPPPSHTRVISSSIALPRSLSVSTSLHLFFLRFRN
uniref:Uncharacterized protein n=1 Tax=Physcomitrium patens TaxID=3218 RepID=A0A2K1J011_PHYPA|nr:hypothetical protein PHYPA_022759 [Physcomitrium patens]